MTVVRMIETFGDRIHFTHLHVQPAVKRTKTFHEAAHLSGDVNMVAVVDAILAEGHVVNRLAIYVLFPFRRITDLPMPGRSA